MAMSTYWRRGKARILRKNGHTLKAEWSMVSLRTIAMGRYFRSRDSSPSRVVSILVRALESPSSVRVLIYDRSGTMILQKDFEVSDG